MRNMAFKRTLPHLPIWSTSGSFRFLVTSSTGVTAYRIPYVHALLGTVLSSPSGTVHEIAPHKNNTFAAAFLKIFYKGK